MQAGYFASVFDYNKDSEITRLWLEDAIEEYEVKPNSSYAVCMYNNDFGLTHFILKYVLLSPNATWFVNIEESDLESLENYEYIFIMEKNDTLKKWINKNYKKQKDNNVIITTKKENHNDDKSSKENTTSKDDKKSSKDKNSKD